jgi:hypothetical protein
MNEGNERAWRIAVVKPVSLGSVKAFVTVELGPFSIAVLSYHESGGRKFVGFPGQPKLDDRGKAVRDERGKIHYYNIIYIADRQVKEEFQRWFIAEMESILPALQQSQRKPPEFRGRVGGGV